MVTSLTLLTSFTRSPAAHGALVVRPIPGYGAHLGRSPLAHGALVVTPLPGYGAHLGRLPAAHGALVVRPLSGYRAPLGRYPGRDGHTGTVHIALIEEHPQLTCRSELTQSTSEQDLN